MTKKAIPFPTPKLTDLDKFHSVLVTASEQGKPLHGLFIRWTDIFDIDDLDKIKPNAVRSRLRQLGEDASTRYGQIEYKQSSLYKTQFVTIAPEGDIIYERYGTLNHEAVLEKELDRRDEIAKKVLLDWQREISKEDAVNIPKNHRTEWIGHCCALAQSYRDAEREMARQRLIKEIVGHLSNVSALLAICPGAGVEPNPYLTLHLNPRLVSARGQKEYAAAKKEQLIGSHFTQADLDKIEQGQKFLPKSEDVKKEKSK